MGWKPHRAGKRECVVRSSLQTWSSRRDSVRQQVIAKRGRCVAAGVMPGACPSRDRCNSKAAHWESALSRSACPHATRESHRDTARQWCFCSRTYGWCRVHRLTERGDESTQLMPAGGCGGTNKVLPRPQRDGSLGKRVRKNAPGGVVFHASEQGSSQVVWTKKMKRLGRRYDYYCEAATRGMQQGRGGVEQEQTPSHMVQVPGWCGAVAKTGLCEP